MSYIKAEHLKKQYNQGEAAVLAVNDISFTIDAGQFVAIMGESGSGKSTLLSMLGVLNTPTSGRLFMDSVDVYSLNRDKRADFRHQSIGFVFQSFHLIPYMTLVENAMLPLAVTRGSNRQKREMAEAALAKVGLGGKGHRLPGQISGGEQERAAIARAVVGNPPLLLADEPTGNLDSKTAQGIMDLLGSLNNRGCTVVMVTHSNEYAANAHRVLRLSDGGLVS